MRMLREKTYKKYLKRIEVLMRLQPKAHTKNGRELLRIARALEKYEKVKFPINHSKRKLRADLVDRAPKIKR